MGASNGEGAGGAVSKDLVNALPGTTLAGRIGCRARRCGEGKFLHETRRRGRASGGILRCGPARQGLSFGDGWLVASDWWKKGPSEF